VKLVTLNNCPLMPEKTSMNRSIVNNRLITVLFEKLSKSKNSLKLVHFFISTDFSTRVRQPIEPF